MFFLKIAFFNVLTSVGWYVLGEDLQENVKIANINFKKSPMWFCKSKNSSLKSKIPDDLLQFGC